MSSAPDFVVDWTRASHMKPPHFRRTSVLLGVIGGGGAAAGACTELRIDERQAAPTPEGVDESRLPDDPARAREWTVVPNDTAFTLRLAAPQSVYEFDLPNGGAIAVRSWQDDDKHAECKVSPDRLTLDAMPVRSFQTLDSSPVVSISAVTSRPLSMALGPGTYAAVVRHHTFLPCANSSAPGVHPQRRRPLPVGVHSSGWRREPQSDLSRSHPPHLQRTSEPRE